MVGTALGHDVGVSEGTGDGWDVGTGVGTREGGGLGSAEGMTVVGPIVELGAAVDGAGVYLSERYDLCLGWLSLVSGERSASCPSFHTAWDHSHAAEISASVYVA